MTNEANKWTKTELQIYILLLCANADSVESKVEIDLIKSKTDQETFDKIYKEFNTDNEDDRFEKIDETVQLYEYTNMELAAFRKEMNTIFFSDNEFSILERNINKIMDNILY